MPTCGDLSGGATFVRVADNTPGGQVNTTPLLGRHRLDRGFSDGGEDLFDNLRVKHRVAIPSVLGTTRSSPAHPVRLRR